MSHSDHSKLPFLLSPRDFIASHFSNTYPTYPTLPYFLPSQKVETAFNILKQVVDFVENNFFDRLFQQNKLK